MAGDARIYRDSLAEALSSRPHLEILGTGPVSPPDPALHSLRPDVVVFAPSTTRGMAALCSVAAVAGSVIAVAVPDDAPEQIACIEAGAAGFVPMGGSLDDLVAAIESATRNEMLCSPRTVAAFIERLGMLAAERQDHWRALEAPCLTAREWEVAELLPLTNKEIGSRLQIEVPTVKNHVHNVLTKLMVRRRFDVPGRLRELEAGSATRSPHQRCA